MEGEEGWRRRRCSVHWVVVEWEGRNLGVDGHLDTRQEGEGEGEEEEEEEEGVGWGPC